MLRGRGVTDDGQIVSRLHYRMKGHAAIERDAWRRMAKQSAEVHEAAGWMPLRTLQEFCEYYEPKFRFEMVDESIRNELEKLRYTGSMIGYVTAEADIVGDYEMVDAERIHYFLKGLELHLAKKLREKQITSFSKLVTAALRHDRNEQLAGGEHSSEAANTHTTTAPRSNSNNCRNPDAMEIDAIHARQADTTTTQLANSVAQLTAAVAAMSTTGRRNYSTIRTTTRSIPARTINIFVNGQSLLVGNQERWVRA